MKILFSFIMLISIGCSQINQTSEDDARQGDSLKETTEYFAYATTALPIEPLETFPSPFLSDSIFIEDTALNFVASIYSLRSSPGGLRITVSRLASFYLALPQNSLIKIMILLLMSIR